MNWVSDCWGTVFIMDVLVYRHFGETVESIRLYR